MYETTIQSDIGYACVDWCVAQCTGCALKPDLAKILPRNYAAGFLKTISKRALRSPVGLRDVDEPKRFGAAGVNELLYTSIKNGDRPKS
jgi:hypothetical protein